MSIENLKTFGEHPVTAVSSSSHLFSVLSLMNVSCLTVDPLSVASTDKHKSLSCNIGA